MTRYNGSNDDQPPVTTDQVVSLLVTAPVDGGDRSTMTERFEAFHRANPGFYDTLVGLARRYLLRTGSGKVGAQRLIEIARWDHEIQTASADFKVNNDFAAFYSRLIMLLEPDLDGAIPTRRSREADEWIASIRRGRAA
mgnify:CR=1 FL=1